MPPKGTWDAAMERDMILSAWCSSNGGDFKADWNKTHEIMRGLGYTFSKEAINQRWSKKVYKDFKERRDGTAGANGSSASAAAQPAAKKPAANTTRKRARATTLAKVDPGFEADDDDSEPKAKKQAVRRAPAPKRHAAPAKMSLVEPDDDEDGDDELDNRRRGVEILDDEDYDMVKDEDDNLDEE